MEGVLNGVKKRVSLTPFTKIIGTIIFSIVAIMARNPLALALVVIFEIALLGASEKGKEQGRTLFAFIGFAVFLGLIQYVFTYDINGSFETALRMLAMALIFLLLLVTTSLQALTTALVEQCKMPYEYAFMFTAALRLIPDFISESQAVREAQMCRGMDFDGSLMTKIRSYASLVQPLVLRSLVKADTMALSLELRGFGSSKHRFSTSVALGAIDYAALAFMVLLLVGVTYLRVLNWV